MCFVPALAGDTPKYVGDVWIVEEEDLLALHGVSAILGVFDTLEGAQKFSEQIGNDPNSLDRKSTRLNSSHGEQSRMPSSA